MARFVFIAGTPKSGSSAFFSWLGMHPEIVPAREKETRFFLDWGYPLLNKKCNVHTQPIEHYFSFFPRHSGILLDATPHYFYNDTPLSAIPKLPFRADFFLLFREPAARIFSSFRYSRDTLGLLPRSYSFRQFVEDSLGQLADPLAAGSSGTILQREFGYSCYDHYLEKWLKAFPRENIHCLLFDDLKSNASQVMTETCETLGISPDFYKDFSFEVKNRTLSLPGPVAPLIYRMKDVVRVPGPLKSFLKSFLVKSATGTERSPEELDTIRRLAALYKTRNRRLAELSGLDLSRWETGHAG